jgi:signal transduction histidine kinase
VAGINVHATVHCHLDGLPAAISLALYRIAQEALLTHN